MVEPRFTPKHPDRPSVLTPNLPLFVPTLSVEQKGEGAVDRQQHWRPQSVLGQRWAEQGLRWDGEAPGRQRVERLAMSAGRLQVARWPREPVPAGTSIFSPL